MFRLIAAVLILAWSVVPAARAQFTLNPEDQRIALDRGLVVEGASRAARRPVNTDAVVGAWCAGTLDPARVAAGDELAPGLAWHEIQGRDGVLEPAKPGSYVLIKVRSVESCVMLLEGGGHAMVYVNGEPRMGDPYGQGYAALPVRLSGGVNTLLVAHAGRGGMKLALTRPSGPIMIADHDLTAPNVWPGLADSVWLGVPVINASDRMVRVTLRATSGDHTTESGPFDVPACSITKVPVRVEGVTPAGSARELPVKLEARGDSGSLAHHTVKLGVPGPGAPVARTLLSRVDGSVQYLSIVRPTDDAPAPALVLSLHGASVEAKSQAGSYAPRAGVVIACPTNRRPYGFDWEDWGRIDALECLEHAASWYHTDPHRQYLTGHSMGGHGTWNLGVLASERFAAIAPSAGWLSFDSYTSAGGPPYAPDSPIGREFQRARASSMTLDYLANLRGKGIYILHGDADDNVPVTQARAAREALTKLNIPHRFHEQPGAGHWWDDDRGPGAACVDWPGIWETFAAASPIADAPTQTPVPLDARGFVEGAFKRVFDRSFVLVYSTRGDERENAWSLAKARFDAEQWWYRGNGFARVMSDVEYLGHPPAGNVILYGHAESNGAWGQLVPEGGPRVGRGVLALGGRQLAGDDLACLLALPQRHDPSKLVGVIGGTGTAGLRATERLNYFTSGVGFPDYVVLRAGAWTQGYDGVEAAGSAAAVTWK